MIFSEYQRKKLEKQQKYKSESLSQLLKKGGGRYSGEGRLLGVNAEINQSINPSVLRKMKSIFSSYLYLYLSFLSLFFLLFVCKYPAFSPFAHSCSLFPSSFLLSPSSPPLFPFACKYSTCLSNHWRALIWLQLSGSGFKIFHYAIIFA